MLAITGGTGHTGCFFIKELEVARYNGPIKCLVRTSSKKNDVNKETLNMEFVEGSLEDTEKIRSLLNGASVVVHIANIHYSLEVLRIGKECGVKRFILVHTTGIYSKYKAASQDYIEIEKKILPMMKEMNITILRPTMIFGDMCDYNISKFIKFVDKLPVLPVVAGGKAKIQPVNARDLAKALYMVLEKEQTRGKAYDVSGATVITIKELYKNIANCLNKRRIILSVPMGICVAGAKVIRLFTCGKYNLEEKVLRMGEDRNYSHKEATNDFGYEPEEFCVGLRREVDEYLGVLNK